MKIGDVSTMEQFVSLADSYAHTKSFDNVCAFLDFCKRFNLNETNSVTYWSDKTQRMFISY